MSQQKITDEQWVAAKTRYETEPGLGYGALAQTLDCSKNLVARKAKEQRWQKSIEACLATARNGRAIGSKVTESAVHPATRAPSVYSNPVPESAPLAAGAAVADQVVVGATAASPALGDISMPDGLDPAEQEAFIRAVVIRRQTELNAVHRKELRAVKAQLYRAINGASEKGGGAATLSVLRAVQAMQNAQKLELEREIERVKLECAVFAGAPLKPQPVRILVHCIPGMRIGGDGETPDAAVKRIYGPNAAAVEKNEVIDV
ncbi:hypothetical protein [Paraburkholderia strydomiana]